MLQLKDIWELASSVIKWGSLLIGGVCLLATSAAIGQFPEDINLGEGIALYFLSAGFVLAYALYWLAVTSIGLCLLRWPMELLRLAHRHIPRHAPAYLPTSFKAMWVFPTWLIALLSALFSLTLFRFKLVDVLTPVPGAFLIDGVTDPGGAGAPYILGRTQIFLSGMDTATIINTVAHEWAHQNNIGHPQAYTIGDQVEADWLADAGRKCGGL